MSRRIRPTIAGLLFLLTSTLGCEVTPRATFDDAFLANEPVRYSQFREEVIVRHFFEDRREGFFLDVGSEEWRDNSTSYYLEAQLGWSGIAIDARVELAPGYLKNRRKTRFFSYLVTDHSGTKDKFYSAGGLSSVHKERFDDLEVFGVPKDFEPSEIEVESITLNDLLAREKVDKIDFLSMDIEEHEPIALAGFDIKRYAPDLVCVEASPSTRERLAAYFSANGYARIEKYLTYDTVNWYFVPKK